MRARIFYLSIIIVGLAISFGLARNLHGIYQNSEFQKQAQQKLEKLRAENIRLKGENTEAKQPNFIEREARERLGLVKPGEVVVVLPEEKEATTTAQVAETGQPRSVWQQWLGLFFGV